MLLFFSFMLILGAFLLFWIQPLVAKMLLPILGGSPLVWNTCVVFFQGALFFGYSYVYLINRYLKYRAQWIVYGCFAIVAASLIHFDFNHAAFEFTLFPHKVSILFHLTVQLGIPIILLATTAPLLQRWFAYSEDPSAKDPYFLYSASNLGSFLALFSFPLLLERVFANQQQVVLWQTAYLFLLACIILAGFWVRVQMQHSTDSPEKVFETVNRNHLKTEDRISYKERFRWLLLSFAPASLLIGLTTHITTDVAATPLFWVLPLAVYLMTFVISFSRKPLITQKTVVSLHPDVLALVLVIIPLSPIPLGTLETLTVLFVAFFIIAMVCHGELAKSRPHVSYLPEFYLWIALGGWLGGLFNTFMAPRIFSLVLEFPCMIVLTSFLRPRLSESNFIKDYAKDVLIPAFLVLPASILIFKIPKTQLPAMSIAILFYILCLISLLWSQKRPFRFGFIVVALLVPKIANYDFLDRAVLYQERNFFGTLSVVHEASTQINYLFNATTIHGAQYFGEDNGKQANTYYLPVDNMFKTLHKKIESLNIAVVGLGVGSTACFAQEKDSITYFEIDPSVYAIARNENFFTHISDCPPKGGVILGDARIKLHQERNHQYDVIILDAFSGDSIPMHLMTLEAVKMYRQKLKKRGVIMLHISNRYLNLFPEVAAIARDLNLFVASKQDRPKQRIYNFASHWVVLSQDAAIFTHVLDDDDSWNMPTQMPRIKPWRDDYSNIARAMRW